MGPKVAHDCYPSRVDVNPSILPRQEPVIFDSGAPEAGPLSADQLETFERDGYLFLPKFYDENIVALLQQELHEVVTSEQVRQSELAVTEPTSGEIRSVFAVHTVNEVLNQLAVDQRLIGMCRQILGSDIYLHQSRLNFKPGFRGKEFYWHSDFETWHAEDGMPAMRAISCSVALTDNFEHNGPLMLIPGSHKHFVQCPGTTPDGVYQQTLKKQDFGVPGDEQLRELMENVELAVPKGEAGSVIIFDCNLIHGSNSNISPYPRSNIFFAYNSIENTLAEPFAEEDQRPWYQANRDPEVIEPVEFAGQHTGTV